jgi:hypothetical protein
MSATVKYKHCRKCGRDLPATREFFYVSKHGHLRLPCRQCFLDRSKQDQGKYPPRSSDDTVYPEKCTVPDCEELYMARGFCRTHYGRWKKHGDPMIGVFTPQTEICTIEGCTRKSHSRSLCYQHYKEWQLAQGHTCTIEGCDRVVHGLGLCMYHYQKEYYKDKQK